MKKKGSIIKFPEFSNETSETSQDPAGGLWANPEDSEGKPVITRITDPKKSDGASEDARSKLNSKQPPKIDE